MAAICAAVAEHGLTCRLQCEPGRALVADGASALARIELRRGDGLYLNDGVFGNLGELKWIGWPGKAIEEPRERQRIEHTLSQDYGFSPVFLSEEEVGAVYEGFANSSLWPLLHYMPSKFRYEPGWWEAYRGANQKFADAVLSVAKPDDLVWVHDYQLMLLPGMLREKMPQLRIGFFLHTPFPSYEIFKCHPRSRELAEGMLGADLIGFHTFGYMRHFRSAVLRLLGIESEMTRIRHVGHSSSIGVYPIGINAASTRSFQSASVIGTSKRSALRSTWSAERAPVQTVATVGWRSGNCSAAAGRETPCASHTSAIAFTRASSAGGACT